MIKIFHSQRSKTFWKDGGAWDAERHHEFKVKLFGITIYSKIEDHKLTPKELSKDNHLIGFKNGK